MTEATDTLTTPHRWPAGGTKPGAKPVPVPLPTLKPTRRPSPPPSGRPLSMSAAVASLLLLAPGEVGTVKASELDRELLDCCAAAHRADQAADAVMDRLDHMTPDDPAILDVLARMQPQIGAYLDAVERATELPARTPEGLQAKAALLLLHLRSGEDHTMLAASLARDVAGRA